MRQADGLRWRVQKLGNRCGWNGEGVTSLRQRAKVDRVVVLLRQACGSSRACGQFSNYKRKSGWRGNFDCDGENCHCNSCWLSEDLLGRFLPTNKISIINFSCVVKRTQNANSLRRFHRNNSFIDLISRADSAVMTAKLQRTCSGQQWRQARIWRAETLAASGKRLGLMCMEMASGSNYCSYWLPGGYS